MVDVNQHHDRDPALFGLRDQNLPDRAGVCVHQDLSPLAHFSSSMTAAFGKASPQATSVAFTIPAGTGQAACLQ